MSTPNSHAVLFVLCIVALNFSNTSFAETSSDQSLSTLQVFPPTDPWNQDISAAPIDKNSPALIAEIGATKPLHPDFGTKYGIPFTLINSKTPLTSPHFDYADQSDPGPYPIPANPQIEGTLASGPNATGDRHILLLDPAEKKLYELWNCTLTSSGWHCGSGAIFNLAKLSTSQRPLGWTSADAAGLPIFPGLARYDEICIKKNLTHALRFTVVKTRRAFIPPASHFASKSNDPALPPMGLRVRLKQSFNITPFPPDAQIILLGLKKYGLILADNGSNWFLSGAPTPAGTTTPSTPSKKSTAVTSKSCKCPPPRKNKKTAHAALDTSPVGDRIKV